MKTVYRPLKDCSQKPQNEGASQQQKQRFDSMLQSHLSQARGQKAKTAVTNDSQLSETIDADAAGLQALKDIDPEYYQKGLKKSTLSQSFSGANSSKLEARLKKYSHLIKMKAKKYDVDPNLLAGLIRQESNFNPYAVSHCGAMGLGQLMPETARYLGVKDPFNASQNIDGAAKYLKEQLDTFGGNVNKALAAYNAGPGAVKRFGGIPPYRETQNYVRSINSHVTKIKQTEMFAETETKDGETKKA